MIRFNKRGAKIEKICEAAAIKADLGFFNFTPFENLRHCEQSEAISIYKADCFWRKKRHRNDEPLINGTSYIIAGRELR